jgi:sugar phosphate permease
MKNISKKEKELIENNRRFSPQAHSIAWKSFFKQRNIWLMMLAFFCSRWSLYFFVAWMPIYLQQGRHFSENEMKATTSVLFIFGIGGGLIAGIVNDWLVKKKGLKFSRKFLGFLSMSMMSLLFVVAATTTSNTTVSIAFIACYPFMPVYGITALSTCVDIGGNNACTIAGFINFAGQIGAFFLAIFFGNIVDFTNNYNAPLFVIASVLITGAFLWLGVNAEKKSINELKDIKQKLSLTPVLIVE